MEALLRARDDRPRISALNLAEVLDVLARHQGWPTADVEEKLRWLNVGGLEVVAVDELIGLTAGRLHAANYHRVRRPLSLADCVALATAVSLDERLATSDPALLSTARDEGCPVVVLLDARGRRPGIQDDG